MANNALLFARNKLMADVSLSAWFVNRYGRDAKHILGYKTPASAHDFPAICYVSVSTTLPDEIGGFTREKVSLVVALNEPGFANDLFDGPLQCAAVETLIVKALTTGSLSANALYLGDATVTYDLGTRHPFYEFEISCLLASR